MELVVVVLILLFSAVFHELMHGVVADRLGDPTARKLGRLTLNPLVHIDPLMSIALPAFLILSGSPILFGAAKPVPVNPVNLKDGKKDLALVSLAGPLTNITIAAVASLLIKILVLGLSFSILDMPIWLLVQIAQINILLAVFNLIPIPPLDGSKVFSVILPSELYYKYLSIERYGIYILFFLLFFPIAGFSLLSLMYKLVLILMQLFGIPMV